MFRLLVGLGNPGARYRETRHNVGFAAVERLLVLAGARWDWADSSAVCAEIALAGVELTLMKPLTYMNLSGEAVRSVARKRGLASSEILVYLDDVALDLGRIRLRERGRAGGHRGLDSIVSELESTDIPRVRIGVGCDPPPEELAEFVLQPFTHAEKPIVERTLDRVVEATTSILEQGMTKAMSKYNAVES